MSMLAFHRHGLFDVMPKKINKMAIRYLKTYIKSSRRKLKQGTKKSHRSAERDYIRRAMTSHEDNLKPLSDYKRCDDLWNYE